MRLKPFYLTARLQTDGQTDGRTDGQGDSSIPPPNFVAGGIIMELKISCRYVNISTSHLLKMTLLHIRHP